MTFQFRRRYFVPARSVFEPAKVKSRASFLPVTALFHLHQACKIIDAAYPESWGVFLVGSCLRRPDYRDVDVRCMLPDEAFDRLFPASPSGGAVWEPRWSLLSIALSDYLVKVTGLPVDFQFQRESIANKKYPGRLHQRVSLGHDVSHGDARKA